MSDIVIAVFTAVAAIISTISFFKSFYNDKERKKIEKEQNEIKLKLNKLEYGKIEIEVNRLISDARKNLIDVVLSIANNKCQDGYQKVLLKLCESCIESELCAYEEACALYIDEKIDRKRFKKSYQTEIRNLFENDNTKEILNSVDCKFNCLKKVYKEWENPEE